ncbi:MAG TPA: DCC1-like thiol-disulfide oxidoreductase family protein [Gaiella sp.]|jgi:predicted DCC family thiol-disulfide oxidoreductase YuxK|nr:DCC1-like thiol-disulfide oxidoreductase family protein [Gaiella sp.]
MTATLVLYDEGCGLCTTFASRLAAHDVAVAPIGSPAGDHWLRDLGAHERYAAFHAIDAAGRRRSGGAAVPLVLEARGHHTAARFARALPRSTDAVYRLVARRRGALSRLAGASACAVGRRGEVRRASRARAG